MQLRAQLLASLSIFFRHAAGHILVFFSFLLIAKSFSPADVGLYHSILSLSLSFSVIGCLRLEVAVFQVNLREIRDLFTSSLLIIIVVALLAFGISLSVLSTINEYANDSLSLSIYITLTIVFISTTQWCSNLFLRQQKFKTFGNIKLVYSASFACAASLFAVLSLHVHTIFLADIIARLLSFLYSLLKSRMFNFIKLLKVPKSISELKITNHKNLIFFGSLGAITSSLSSTILSLILAGVFGLSAAGHFAIIERLVFSPLGLLSGAISQAINSLISNASRNDANSNLLKTSSLVFLALTVLGFTLFFLLEYFIPRGYKLIFNEENSLSIEIFRTLLPLAIVSFIATPYNMALTIMGLQRIQFLWDFARFGAILYLFLFTFNPTVGVIESLRVYANVQITFYAVFITLTFAVMIRKKIIDRNY